MKFEILDDNQNVINTIQADLPFVERQYPNRYREISDSTGSLQVTKFTKLEFQLRFTFDELVAIETAAASNPGIRVLQNQQAIAEYIDIADENTVLGVMYLVSQGILTHARGLEILTP